MISVVLYGRNDSYGYNLHKRAALSLNCIAALLDDDADEILFVDYNTPNDFPTFPEAIQDTLTDQAKRKLRILRVRPHIHDRLRHRTRLLAIEPHSRNVAVRRSNPENRWILSTNTDMIFVPTRVPSLSEVVRHLPAGFYHAPRLEIPETLWEGLNRQRPHDIIETVRAWGWTLHLNEVVKSADFILYDGPGDFQLLERKVLFDTQAFHEDMILGWHVDSNIAKRMFLHYGQIGDLGGEVYGYHCDHTRQITPAHSHSRTQNDPHRFVYDVERPDIPEQSLTWGCPNDEIDEIRLERDSSSVYVSALLGAVGAPLRKAPVVHYTPEAYNKSSYQPSHVLPFLADLFVCAPRSWNVGWIGEPDETLAMFGQVWESLGFEGHIFVDEDLTPTGLPLPSRSIRRAARDVLIAEANGFVFNFAVDQGIEAGSAAAGIASRLRPVRHSFFQVVGAEQQRIRDKVPLRQIIAVNAINNDYEGIVTAHVAVGLTPFATRMRHGYVLPAPDGPQDWTPDLWAGAAGLKEGDAIRMRGDVAGFVAYGPYKNLLEGRYRIVFALSGTVPGEGDPDDHVVAAVEIRSRGDFIDWGLVTAGHVRRGDFTLEFDVTRRLMDDGVKLETLVRSWRPADILLRTLTCEKIGTASVEAAREPVFSLGDWLPLMSVETSGRREGEAIASDPSRPGLLTSGPYWALPSGCYRAEIVMSSTGEHVSAMAPGAAVASVEIASGDRMMGGELLLADGMVRAPHLVDFVVTPEDVARDDVRIEIRIASWARLPLRISALRVRRIGDVEERRPGPAGPRVDWWIKMELGPAGFLTADGVAVSSGIPGLVLRKTLAVSGTGGRYDLLLDVADPSPSEDRSAVPDLLVELVEGGTLLARSRLSWAELMADGQQGLAFDLPPVEDGAGTRLLHARVFALADGVGLIRGLRVRPAEARERQVPPPRITEMDDLLPSLRMGIAQFETGGVAAVRTDVSGVLVFGPHWSMPAGSYRIGLLGELGQDGLHPCLVLEVVVDEVVVSTRTAWPSPGSFSLQLDAEILPPRTGRGNIVQFRVSADRARGIVLRALKAEPANEPLPSPAHLSKAGSGSGLALPAGRRGYHSLGTPWKSAPGHHRSIVHLTAAGFPATLSDAAPVARIEVWAGGNLIAAQKILAGDLRAEVLSVELTFVVVGGELVEVRIWNIGLLGLRVEGATVHKVAQGTAEAAPRLAIENDWLPYLTLGPAGRLPEPGLQQAEAVAIGCETGGGLLVFGPYWSVPAGSYRIGLEGILGQHGMRPCLVLEVVVDEVVVSAMTAWPSPGPFALHFDVEVPASGDKGRNIVQFRVSADHTAGITLRALTAKPAPPPAPSVPASLASLPGVGAGNGLALHAGLRGHHPLGAPWMPTAGPHRSITHFIAAEVPDALPDTSVVARMEVMAGPDLIAARPILAGELRSRLLSAKLPFAVVDGQLVETRVWNTGLLEARVEASTVHRVDHGSVELGAVPATYGDWLPYLTLGPAAWLPGRPDAGTGVFGREDGGGFLVFGPYRPMPAGPCRVTLEGEMLEANAPSGLLYEMVVLHAVVSAMMAWPRVGPFELVLDGLVSQDAASARAAVQFRVSAAQSRGIRLAALTVADGDAVEGRRPTPRKPSFDARRESRGGFQLPADQRGYRLLGDLGPKRPGRYKASVFLAAEHPPEGLADATVLVEIEAVSGKEPSAVLRLTAGAFRDPEVLGELVFDVACNDATHCDLKLWSSGLVTVRVESATLREVEGDEFSLGNDMRPTEEDWLPFLGLGQRGMLTHGTVWSSTGEAGVIVSGPGRRLPPGPYRLFVSTGLRQGGGQDHILMGSVDVCSDSAVLATAPLSRGSFAAGSPTLDFDVDPPPRGQPNRLVEIQIHSTGVEAFALLAVELRGRDASNTC